MQFFFEKFFFQKKKKKNMKAGPGYTAHHPTYLPWYLPTYPRYIFKNVKIRLAKV